ncbi:MAG: hypothetical protein A2428_06825 [Bdellovibrionales bacterium RIFOXYC1_FULL_54_43]|nr:MAG: hypothetical protein A2428_06825 [Bdellovibrionales bacterium RIFOXYC1_FULL_54_43]OFZ80021.1 MAG: hypothetical protein A2603_02295 [Bdellovibrionales bacterium RIFOXYD1_FULL_55_31]
MSREQNELSDHVTVLVFKDNYAARTFQIPLGWITRFGVLIGGLVGIAILTSILAIKYYRAVQHASPARVQDLEQELSDLRSAVNAKTTGNPVAPVQNVSSTVAFSNDGLSGDPAAMPSSVPGSEVLTRPFLFTGLPAGTRIVERSTIPIAIHAARANWEGKTLSVNFNIQYHLDDRRNQQGRIIILARGPETLVGYPAGILGRIASGSLISPEQGEYFSVSRFREVKARFGPMASQNALNEVEIILLNEKGEVLLYEKLVPNGVTTAVPQVQTVIQPQAPQVLKAVPAATEEQRNDPVAPNAVWPGPFDAKSSSTAKDPDLNPASGITEP